MAGATRGDQYRGQNGYNFLCIPEQLRVPRPKVTPPGEEMTGHDTETERSPQQFAD